MKQIVLIACVSKKGDKKAKARDLYRGPLFINSLAYAQSLNPEKIFILSALYYLLDLDEVIEPYNVTLSNVPAKKRKPGLRLLNASEKKQWGAKVIELLSERVDLKNDKFIFLAGQEYIKPLRSSIVNLENPLDKLRQGERVSFLKSRLNGS